jgi:hypothetical protein
MVGFRNGVGAIDYGMRSLRASSGVRLNFKEMFILFAWQPHS